MHFTKILDDRWLRKSEVVCPVPSSKRAVQFTTDRHSNQVFDTINQKPLRQMGKS